MRREITKKLAGLEIVNQSSHGNIKDEIFAGSAIHVFSHPVLAALGFILWEELEIEKACLVASRFKIHVAATAAISAIGTAERDVFFSSETDATVAARSRSNANDRFVNESHTTPKAFSNIRLK